ncbi:acid protease [Eremomyces bilateralis CBS 781.70]|uniref:Acid protease n=1 Tax=Eremomyces bilateralis CBS 781.70 TaxID=1392243 RepID=A0A6G1FQF0_9PEZI|nr:acid protease [Eremomyces bilateralis CBS 781.70]KAF1807976.1 acid protease [Eremomyces bilateralis CBS 781.70]
MRLPPLLLALSGLATAAQLTHMNGRPVNVVRPAAFSRPSELKEASHVARFEAIDSTGSQSHNFLKSALAVNRAPAAQAPFSEAVIAIRQGRIYSSKLAIGSQIFDLIMDTGSSDTWVASEHYICDDGFGHDIGQDDCLFGPAYTPSPTSQSVPGLTFNISYADGEFLDGQFVHENVALGGLEVEKQQIAIIDRAFWFGDNKSSGLMGLAYPELTNSFPNGNVSRGNGQNYESLMFSLIRTRKTDPLFSIALDRTSQPISEGGVIAIGGLPPGVAYHSPWAVTPIELFQLLPSDNQEFTFYAIGIQGIAVGKLSDSRKFRRSAKFLNAHSKPQEPKIEKRFLRPRQGAPVDLVFPIQFIVDSGTTLNYLPAYYSEAIAAAYEPPAVYNWLDGLYHVQCNATVPYLAFQIGGQMLQIPPQDMIFQWNGTGTGGQPFCYTGFADASQGINVLGGPFMKNVISVFDIGGARMHFAQRWY